MKKQDEIGIRKALLVQRREIEREMLSHGGARAPGSGGELRDAEDRAAALGDLLVDDRIARDDGNLLSKIDFALERLEAGTYAQCTSCGGEIPKERLLAKPSVSLCVACQVARERV